MSVFFRPKGSNNVFHFFEVNKAKTEIKTISYQLDTDSKILGKWKKNGTIKQLMGAINSVAEGKSEIISESDWKNRLTFGIREIFELTKNLGGTISGEHGIGLVQKEYLGIVLSDKNIELQKGIKKLFDPNQILNPGKIF